MAYVRKDQAALTDEEWSLLIQAIDGLHGPAAPSPAYRAFVAVHVDSMFGVGMSWGVHTMRNMGMVGRNFLAWHRQYLLRFEHQLQQVAGPEVSVPYWDSVGSPSIPEPLADWSLLQRWSVARGDWNPAFLPTAEVVRSVLDESGYEAFQSDLEAIHGGAHNAVGGDMETSRSPNDPLFWLHHANIDRLFAEWQVSPRGGPPPNGGELLQPSPILGVSVEDVMSIDALGYSYA